MKKKVDNFSDQFFPKKGNEYLFSQTSYTIEDFQVLKLLNKRARV